MSAWDHEPPLSQQNPLLQNLSKEYAYAIANELQYASGVPRHAPLWVQAVPPHPHFSVATNDTLWDFAAAYMGNPL